MTSFTLDTFLAQPRLGGLALSPDGRRLVVGVQTPGPKGTRFRTALWLVDTTGERAPRQLTRSAPGESSAAFLPDGSLLFLSARPDPDATDRGDDPPAALWRLAPDGGDPSLVLAPPGGVQHLEVASESGDVVVGAPLHPGTDTFAADAARDKARSDAGVTAQLFEDYPIRFWDHTLGPREAGRWFLAAEHVTDDPARPAIADSASAVTDDASGDEASGDDAPDPHPGDDIARLLCRGRGVLLTAGSLTPDGRTYVTAWSRLAEGASPVTTAALGEDLVAIDTASGARRTLVADGRGWGTPCVAPDGRRVVAPVTTMGVPERSQDTDLAIVDLETGEVVDLDLGVDVWPANPRWTPDGTAVVFEADQDGHRPLFHCTLDGDGRVAQVVRLTADGAHTEALPTPDGTHVIAMRSGILTPPRPTRVALGQADQTPEDLRSPVGDDPTGVEVERIVATADDGVEVGAWLVRPTDVEGPVPLVTFIHGGPRGSWNAWSWRWCPTVVATSGAAVLLPDPAISTGYGQDFHDRGWGTWGERPFTDVLSTVDAAAAHEAVDGERLAAMGGSFGGYLANWIAGHDHRFRCIVTHASLWNLPAFHGTTDLGLYWETEFGSPYEDPTRYVEYSPHRAVADITTPMLVIHGERDLRVPISEALMLWTDLKRNGVDARFLYFPDENHWVLKPQNARLWYETVLAFLAEHLDDADFERPELL
ncbi:MAG: S9 family peptidase [Nitriliruptoraceae bacterium]|nr:S9 family peptidase [Nitriliruptoraceae bacterium]